jgi:hypothetical protein
MDITAVFFIDRLAFHLTGTVKRLQITRDDVMNSTAVSFVHRLAAQFVGTVKRLQNMPDGTINSTLQFFIDGLAINSTGTVERLRITRDDTIISMIASPSIDARQKHTHISNTRHALFDAQKVSSKRKYSKPSPFKRANNCHQCRQKEDKKKLKLSLLAL